MLVLTLFNKMFPNQLWALRCWLSLNLALICFLALCLPLSVPLPLACSGYP